MSIKFGDPYKPIKILELGPSIYDTRKLPTTIDIQSKGVEGIRPIHQSIDKQYILNLPFILSIKIEDGNDPEIHSTIQKTGQVFYFTINNKNEKTFKYLGKSNETNKEKKVFLDTFIEANKGSAEAQVKLAVMYAQGNGVKKNNTQSIKYYSLSMSQAKSNFIWYKYLAEDHKRPEAQYQLARHLQEGIGTEKNENESIRYFKLSANQNHQGALLALASYYASSPLVDL